DRRNLALVLVTYRALVEDQRTCLRVRNTSVLAEVGLFTNALTDDTCSAQPIRVNRRWSVRSGRIHRGIGQ
ncbi:MAG: hypothetical protein LBJ08_04630, partial [Bifidobacteriaceae bacterium]|nr:hypothetical protein [Bifidobacteriaceae bacterium]